MYILINFMINCDFIRQFFLNMFNIFCLIDEVLSFLFYVFKDDYFCVIFEIFRNELDYINVNYIEVN